MKSRHAVAMILSVVKRRKASDQNVTLEKVETVDKIEERTDVMTHFEHLMPPIKGHADVSNQFGYRCNLIKNVKLFRIN